MIASVTTSSTPATQTPKEKKESLETAAATSVKDTLEKSGQEVSFKEEEEVNIEKIESCVEDLFSKLHAQFNDSQSILKTLANNLKILHKEVQKEKKELIKNAKKTKKIKKKKTSVSGFAKPSRISEKLADFLQVPKEELIARTDATKMVLDYVKKNNLQNPDYKKQILPDEKLRNLLEPHFTNEDKLEYFNIQKFLKYHFLKE
jgi:chromatin remodeling complex protein RSC6